jgi:hypothetical protein
MTSGNEPNLTPDRGRDERAERLAALRRSEQDQGRRKRRLIVIAAIIGGVIVLALIIMGIFAPRPGSSADAAPAGVDPAVANVSGETVYPDVRAGHVRGDVAYPADPNPPVGGQHDPTWQNANGDVYTAPLRNEHAVHSLEHGAVWITYQPTAGAAVVAALAAKVEGQPYRMMSPLPGQPSPISLTAWGHQLRLDTSDDPRIDAFITAYAQGPQAPEPGGPVTGGRAEP